MNIKYLFSAISISVLISVLIFKDVNANAQIYNSITTIGYGNAIFDQGDGDWGGVRITYTTNPYIFIDQLGATVWTTYNMCGNTVVSSTFIQYNSNTNPWMIAEGVRSFNDTAPRYDGDIFCSNGQVKKRVNYIQHFWQHSNYTGGGSTITKTTSQLSPTFIDVPLNHWAYYWIEPMYQIGIMDPVAIQNSCSTSHFCPDSLVTRAQMAYFLERGLRGSNYSFPNATGIFSDVPTNHWAAKAIERLYLDGVTGGCSLSPLSYCPNNYVTRSQMAIFLLRAEHGSNYTPPPATGTMFEDVSVNTFAAAWIEQLANEGITAGCNSNPPLFCPNNYTSRAEMAIFVHRAFSP